MADMEYLDLYQQSYDNSNMQPTFQDQTHHGQEQVQQQYPLWSHHLVALYQQQQQQRAAMMLGQASLQTSKQTEPKPRLAKDEVELLEGEFAKNPKPNSSTKRELAEQMGVEVARINNWFQNRRAKEKQMKKTAEFEAQQARQRSNSESKSGDEEDQGTAAEFYGLSKHRQRLRLSTAAFGEPDSANDDSDTPETETEVEQRQQTAHTQQVGESLDSDRECLVHIKYEHNVPMLHHPHPHGLPNFGPSSVALSDSFSPVQNHASFHPPTTYAMGLTGQHLVFDGLPAADFSSLAPHSGILPESSPLDTATNGNYFAVPPLPQFPSQLITEPLSGVVDNGGTVQGDSMEPMAQCDSLSPRSMATASPTPPDMRFKSPPPPADIAGRRNLRRPAPLGISALRGVPHGSGPKTGVDAPRRPETASSMRRISSATGGLSGRVQKPFSNSGGPRSPFLMDRNKEALFQSLQPLQSPIMSSVQNPISPETPEGMNTQALREDTVSTAVSDDEHGYTFGSLGAVGSFPAYNVDQSIKTPPDTPGLAGHFPEHFYSTSVEQAWSFIPHDEPLPTPSLCSHGGSEIEFSMAQHMPGYVASQPVTPSFPPSVGPTYGGFFGGNVANAEYNFPDTYASESSARSSPAGPPKSRQFQFAQNVTPQDYNPEK
ncbi:hypothetical protein OQA88_10312 [Cercophora sp. LCS_1]